MSYSGQVPRVKGEKEELIGTNLDSYRLQLVPRAVVSPATRGVKGETSGVRPTALPLNALAM